MDRRSKAVLSLTIILVMALLFPAGAMAKGPPDDPGGGGGGGGGGKPDGDTTAGNNLSFPVIWAEGVTKALPGTPLMTPTLNGEWWYQWGTNGTDPDVTPASCAPDPDDNAFCDDGVLGTAVGLAPGDEPADNPLDLAKAYLQKDTKNIWQAGSADWKAEPVNVNWIDWGDNLESLAWTLKSQVRTEVVLFQDLASPMLEYQMRHTDGWGIDEVHGLAADLAGAPLPADGNQATVYSACARLTIQRLLVDRDDVRLPDLIWVAGEGWTEPDSYLDDLINTHIFNGSVHEGGDGPGYYSAEINVKGRIIYGYTWNVRNLNEGAGDYRLTFSFDDVCATVPLNTYFVEGTTEIIVPVEEVTEVGDVSVAAEPVSTGGTAVLDFDNNLTYIDISIVEKGGGGKK